MSKKLPLFEEKSCSETMSGSKVREPTKSVHEAARCVGGGPEGPRNGLEQRTPKFSASGTGFMEDNFSMDWEGRGVVIQTHTFIAYFISIIITSAPPQIIRH